MSTGMPELGSKISLISKADIRYEGRLFTVDPQECTIALANVKSFGTEDREVQFPVAAQNQVYEYILFRGSDIKDIRVVNSVSSLPNDPAIVQMQVQQAPMGQQSFQPQPGYGHPMMGQMGGMGGQFGPPYGMAGMGAMGPMMGMAPQNRQAMAKQPSELGLGPIDPSASAIPNLQSAANVEPLPKDQSLEDGVMDIINGGSRSTTPTSLLARKSPTIDQSTQVNQQGAQNIGKIGDKHLRNQAPHRPRDDGRTSGLSQYSEGKQHQQHKDSQMHRGDHHMQGQGGHQNMRQQQNRGPGGWVNQRGQMRGGNRGMGGGGNGGPRGGPRGGNFRNQQPLNAKPKNTLKFDNDYDFEQANTEFEELRSQLAKTKIDGGAETNEKKDDSGNETGAGDNEPEEDSEVVHYDKAKSFFDNISCEAVERSKGRSQRTDWRTERKLNSETFGVASMRRGGFRGGRGYYNRGGNMGGGMYRNNQGGNQNYRGGYRGQRGGNQARKPNQNQQNNAPSNMGTTGSSSNQNRNAASSNNEQQSSAAPSASTSTTQPQQNNRLLTGTA